MHHIEGSASGLPVLYHKDGGGINELCKSHGVEFYDTASLLEGLDVIISNYDDFVSRINTSYLSSNRMCGEYLNVF
jgi:hypothetical protein